ncbi:MAG: CAP domain-containing protein [Chloroflexota bacterium]|nr:CAP domain-containing protein [Chloroflexota bacterium]
MSLQGESLCFAQNGLCIGEEFRRFWEQNGGLEVFGLPISPPYQAPVITTNTTTTTKTTQTSPDTSVTTTVITTTSTTSYFLTQWFERASFEFHPENKEPYKVLLGRLGDLALRKTDRSPASFARADPKSANYFPETGQSVAPQFWLYWRFHGLDMGQEGVSLQESLGLFGYPISPAITEKLSDGKEYVVQYFERARFEHHTENADPRYQVLLGLLGKTVKPANAPTAGARTILSTNTGSEQSTTKASAPVPTQAPAAPQPPPPPPPPPPPAPTSTPQPQAPAVSAPPPASGSSALARVNWYRGITGLGQFTADGALANAGAAHANYLVHNPPGDLHNETAGREGFSGVTPLDRVRAAGYSYPSGFFVTDLVVDTNHQVTGIDELMDLSMHRVLLLNPQYTQMGVGSAVLGGRAYTVVVIATGPLATLPKGEPKVVSYPVNGQSGVPVAWDYSEWPSPYPAGSTTPVGYPLTLTGAYGPLRVETAWLKDAAGAAVNVHPNPAVCVSNPAYNCYQLMPVSPLAPDTTYTAYAKGLIGGKPFEGTWSFKTGTASVP